MTWSFKDVIDKKTGEPYKDQLTLGKDLKIENTSSRR